MQLGSVFMSLCMCVRETVRSSCGAFKWNQPTTAVPGSVVWWSLVKWGWCAHRCKMGIVLSESHRPRARALSGRLLWTCAESRSSKEQSERSAESGDREGQREVFIVASIFRACTLLLWQWGTELTGACTREGAASGDQRMDTDTSCLLTRDGRWDKPCAPTETVRCGLIKLQPNGEQAD